MPPKNQPECCKSLRNALRKAEDENARLRQLLAERDRYSGHNEHPTRDDASSSSSPSLLEYENLKRAYDDLRREKEALAAKYNADYQKWRKFKHWLLSQDVKSSKTRDAKARSSTKEVDEGVESVVEEHPGKESTRTDGPSTPKAVLRTINIGSPSDRPKKLSLSPEVPYTDTSPLPDSLDDSERARPSSAQPAAVTINSRFRLKAKENNGRDYQYEEVVRNKEERRRLHGTDCECCREYYAAIGPLPSRAQAPLWRTPTSTPTKRRRNASASDDEDVDADIAHHIHEISRHRAVFEAPATPPGYWDMGFPDTQEVASINARAREMHAQKMRRVEAEARRGGRYEKR